MFKVKKVKKEDKLISEIQKVCMETVFDNEKGLNSIRKILFEHKEETKPKQKFTFKDLKVALKNKDVTERDLKFIMLGSALATILMYILFG